MLAKARKMRKPGMLGLKKFGLGNPLCPIQKGTQNIQKGDQKGT